MSSKKKTPRNIVTPEKAKRVKEAEAEQQADREHRMKSPAGLVLYLHERRGWFWAVWRRWQDDPITGGFAASQTEATAKVVEAAEVIGGVTTWTNPSSAARALDYLEKNNLLT